jgi:hypothetical protein
VVSTVGCSPENRTLAELAEREQAEAAERAEAGPGGFDPSIAPFAVGTPRQDPRRDFDLNSSRTRAARVAGSAARLW